MFIQGLLDLPPPPNPTIQFQGRTINLADLTEREATLRNMIQNQEMQMRQLQAQRAGMPDNVFMEKMRTFQVDITNRKESLNKIITLTNICMQQNSNNGGDPLCVSAITVAFIRLTGLFQL